MANKVAYHNTVIDTTGIGTLATITVYNPGTVVAATIYSTPAGAAASGAKGMEIRLQFRAP